MKDSKLLLLSAFVFASIFYALTTGNGIEPSALIPKLQADVTIFNQGATFEPLLPQPPME